MPTVSHISRILQDLYPLTWADTSDNVGLLVGDGSAPVSRVLLCIDLTAAVLAEAAAASCQMVIAYHPPIYTPLKSLTSSGSSSIVYQAVQQGIAIYSPHTALDAAPGGTNDMLADLLGLTHRKPLKPAAPLLTQSKHCKLVTFVPDAHVEKLADAICASGGDGGLSGAVSGGAGVIGAYSHCTFRTAGTGTFFGDDSSNPAVGTKGQLQQVDEIRLEVIVPLASLPAAVAALKAAHPYETPAYDIIPLLAEPPSQQAASPAASIGLGRIGQLPPGYTRASVIASVKQKLALPHVLIAGPADDKPVLTAACCAGSCGSLLDLALAQGAHIYLTGEMRHHDALKAASQGMTVIMTLHSNSERPVLQRVAKSLSDKIPALQYILSQRDVDPISVA